MSANELSKALTPAATLTPSAKLTEIKEILQQAHRDAFGLHEFGGSPEECHDIIANAWRRIENILGVQRVCYGCGSFVSECQCAE